MKPNQDIENRIFSSHLKKYEIAAKVGISDSRFSIWLRTPLNEERKQRVLNAIDELKKEMMS